MLAGADCGGVGLSFGERQLGGGAGPLVALPHSQSGLHAAQAPGGDCRRS